MAQSGKIEVEKAKPPEAPATEAPAIEHWWSASYANHMLQAEEAPGGYVKFRGYGLDLDLSSEKDRQRSEALHASGREGRDIFVVGDAYPENEVGKQTEFMRRLRRMSGEVGGIEKLRGLFTYRELVKAGLSAATDDVDALIMLALRTKSIGEMKE